MQKPTDIEIENAACRMYFRYFVERAFKIINPSTPYLHNWHIDLMSEYLQACHNREIKRLIINVPPRSLKSVCTNVAWPAWILGRDPSARIMSASYSLDLSLKHSVDCRTVIEHEWYQQCFPNTKIAKDQNEKSKYMTNERGHRFATSVGGTTTGEGANILIVDDPHSALQAQSDTIRESQIEWYDRAYSTRLDDKERGVIVVIMQRLHQNDLTGHLLRMGGWEHLKIPGIFEKPKTFSIGSFKKDVEAGELLHAKRETVLMLEVMRRQLGEFGWAGQYMQNPVPEGGGIVKSKWFNLWPANERLPRFAFVMQVWDTAFTEKTSGDPSGCITLGVFFPDDEVSEKVRNMGGGFGVMLIDCFCEHLGFPDLRKKMIEMRSYRYGDMEKAVDLILIEKKASGQSILQELKNAGLPVKAFNPGRLDKTARLHAVSHFIENGMVYIPESTRREGEFRDWAMDFVNQVCSFPAAEHDEYVDCLSSGLATLSEMTFLRVEQMAEDIDESAGEDPYAMRHRINPYSQ